jgi:hypothetical protein
MLGGNMTALIKVKPAKQVLFFPEHFNLLDE